jgi:hypothetical protein
MSSGFGRSFALFLLIFWFYSLFFLLWIGTSSKSHFELIMYTAFSSMQGSQICRLAVSKKKSAGP